MTKRILAAFLWFYTGWYAGAMLAEFLSVSPVLGPIIGAAAAGLIVGDPRGIIWKRQAIAPGVRARHVVGPRGSRRARLTQAISTDTPGPQGPAFVRPAAARRRPASRH